MVTGANNHLKYSMANSASTIIIHNSVYDLTLVEKILKEKGFHIIKGTYFAEVVRKINGDEIIAGYAAVGKEDISGIDFLRSLMEYNLVIQRVLLTASENTELYKKAINRSHVNYVLDYPPQQSEIETYIRKIDRRYARINKPFERFSALSEVTEDLLTQNEKYREEASTDTLTKLFNRRTFDRFIKRYWKRWEESQVSFCLALVDLDYFKKVNDTYGHTAGDVVLRVIANIFNSNKRTGIDFAFRYGGEEFAIISASISEYEMDLYINRLNKIVRETVIKIPDNQKITVTISAGVCSSVRANSIHNLVDNADKSLYQAKESGRDRVIVFK
jgi:diguanylate cyclase (GGDEF)-like protein